MLNNIRAVLFDLDGTLVDSMWMWKDIDIEYLGSRHLPLPEDLQRSIEGMSLTETAVYFKKRFALPDDLEEIKKEWMDMAREKYRSQVPLKPGAREFLWELRRQGIRTGIASSNGMEMIQTVLKAQQVEALFDSVHTCCEVKRGKPSPDIYQLVASDLGSRRKGMSGDGGHPHGTSGGPAGGDENLRRGGRCKPEPEGREAETGGLLYPGLLRYPAGKL